ncbi:hypothetical protein ACSS7Z_01210 [Microbacterium sp. A82]|uniref:hypothetical protein n=1 Tax=Microbacterium sp. A82 TaxID=3450452 RepID=UPI003F30F65B
MMLPTLERYSKLRRAGDQTSGGRGKLLRPTSALSRIELLVRETLQNSWDAKDPEWTPAYGVRIYEMEAEAQRVLRDSVFTALPESLAALSDSLRAPGVRAIEIYDRGTHGLNGPYRASEPGDPNNFTSFVFDIGTTKSSETSGGTYGFGKTATFEVSNAHSVVYWSRCRGTDGNIEHRLIASTLHEPYVHAGARYTGAHWWGVLEGEEDILPVRGEAARRLGEAIFRTHFGDAEDGDPETGTSILVIDPIIAYSTDGQEMREAVSVRTELHEGALLRQVTDALAYSAWPKVVPTSEDNDPMLIGLYENRVRHDVKTDILEKYAEYASALTQIRREQGELHDDFSLPEPDGVIRRRTFAITLRRPRSGTDNVSTLFGARASATVGHLHLIESVKVTGTRSTAPSNALCLMRHEAELVVRYDRIVDEEDELLQWHGVFKPTKEFDRHFREAEPPTHDRWTPDSAESEESRYIVKKTLEHLKSKTRAFLSESRSQEAHVQRNSVRNVAIALRSFVPFGSATPTQEDAAVPRRRERRGEVRSGGQRSNVQILQAQALSGGAGQALELLVESRNGGRLRVYASIYALTADGRLPLNADEASVEWLRDGATFATGSKCLVESGQKLQMLIRTRVAAALEVGFESEIIE